MKFDLRYLLGISKQSSRSYRGVDLLSFNPQLVSILSFVHPLDIVNCRLVSRRFNTVISRNIHFLPKIPVTLDITVKKDENTGATAWIFYISDMCRTRYSPSYIYISDRRIRLSKTPIPFLFHYFHRNGSYLDVMKEHEDECLFTDTKNHFSPSDSLDFHTPSKIDGFRLVLSLLSHVFRPHTMWFMTPSSSSYLSLLTEVFRQTRSVCSLMYIYSDLWTQLDTFYFRCGRPVISIRDIFIFNQWLPSLCQWNSLVVCPLRFAESIEMETAANFDKLWQQGQTGLSYVFFPNDSLSDNWDLSVMFNYFYHLKYKVVHFTKSAMEMFVKREMDDSVVRVFFSNRHEYMLIHDIEYVTMPNEFRRILKAKEIPSIYRRQII